MAANNACFLRGFVGRAKNGGVIVPGYLEFTEWHYITREQAYSGNEIAAILVTRPFNVKNRALFQTLGVDAWSNSPHWGFIV
jgi:hypothetical protein